MSEINAFDKLNPSQPLQPLDWEFLAKAKELQQQKQLKMLDLTQSAEDNLPLQGGYATKDAAKEYTAKVIQPALNSFRDRIVKGEDHIKVYGELRAATSKIQNDPVYQTIKADEAYTPQVDKSLQDPLFTEHIQDYYNPQTGFKQKSLTDLSGFSPPLHYKGVEPVNAFLDFKPYYDKIVAQKTKEYDPTQYQQFYDENGNLIIKSRTDGRLVESITPEQIEEAGRRLAYDEGSGFMNLPSMRYLQAKLQRDTEGSQNPIEAGIQSFKNNYMGYLKNYIEMQPKESQQVIKATKDSSSKDKTQGDDLPNEVAKALDRLGSFDSTGNIKGETKVRAEVLGPILGGKTKDGKITLPIDSDTRPVFLQVPKVTTGATESENFTYSQALRYVGAYNSAKREFVNEELSKVFINPNTNESGHVIIPGQNNNYVYSSIKGKDKVFLLPTDKTNISNKELEGYKSISLDEFLNNELQNTPLKDTPEGQKLLSIVDKTKSKYNLNIADPNIQNKILKLNTSAQGKAYQETAVALNNLNGDYEFVTDEAGSNLFLDQDGTPVGKGFIYMDGQELSQLMPSFEEAIKAGVIKPAGFKKVISENGTTVNMPRYKIPIYKPTDANIENVTQSYADAAYGSRKDIDDYRSTLIDQSNAAYDKFSIKRNYMSFSKDFDSRKEPEPMWNDLSSSANELASIDEDSSMKALSVLRSIYDKYSKNPKNPELKKELYLMHLAIKAKKSQLESGNPNTQEALEFAKAKEALK